MFNFHCAYAYLCEDLLTCPLFCSQEALSALYPLLGHVPAVIAGGKAAPWPEYGLLTAAGGKEAYERLGGSVPHWGGQGGDRIVEAHNLASELEALQFPKAGCRGRPLMLHTLGDRNSGWGMGSMLHVMSLALASAYAHNRTLVLPDKDEWWYADEACRPRGFGCYFEPISSCRQGDSTDIVGSHAYEVKKTYVPAKYARYASVCVCALCGCILPSRCRCRCRCRL